eukprot:1420094-Amphidinium_carterae.1
MHALRGVIPTAFLSALLPVWAAFAVLVADELAGREAVVLLPNIKAQNETSNLKSEFRWQLRT